MAKKLSDLDILVVDDNPRAINLMKMVLSGLGVNQIYTAENGKLAKKFLSETDYLVDLIICDWRMPNMTGLQLLEEVRSVHPRMPFMMVTGKSDATSVVAAKGLGVSAYITKPFSPQQFEQKLRALMRQL